MTATLPPKEAFSPGKSHPSFTDMGKRFLVWLGSDISKAGAAYQPGPKFSTYDEENVRKCQMLMGDTPDEPGEAYFGPRQWDRLFAAPPSSPSAPVVAGDLTIVKEPIAGMPGLRPFKTGGGKPKIVLHTVEGSKPDWASKGSGTPHFTYDYDGTAYHHLEFDVAAYTLANSGGGPSPNSDAGVVIQIEMCGFAKDSATRSDEWYAGLLALLEHIGKAIDCPVEFPLSFGGSETYGVNGPARLDWNGYTRTTGVIGHQHVPKNDHWDPGKIDTGRLRPFVEPVPEPEVETEEPVTPPEDDRWAVLAAGLRSLADDIEKR